MTERDSSSDTDVDPRAELGRIAASLRAYLEWQRESGAIGIPRLGKARPATAAPAPPPAPPPAPAAAPVPVVVPSFLEAEPAPKAAPPAAPPAAPAAPSRPLPVVADAVASCTRCELSKTRTHTVFSRGNPAAKLCFVGEAPGADEDAQGLPFVGRAGQLLDKMIGAMGLDPDQDVYVCNILKCRPPGNRRPTPEESETCIPYLHEQLAAVDPKVIVALGNTAVASLIGGGTTLGITKLRGSWKLYRGRVLVMPTYHPSYLLREGPHLAQAKREAWADLQKVMKEMGLAPKKSS